MPKLMLFTLLVVLFACTDTENSDHEYNSIDQTPLSEAVKSKIKTYVSTNNPNNSIVEVEIESQFIEVELNNNIELLFSLIGGFIAYDND